MLPPIDVLWEIVPAGIVSALVLLATFPWRKQAWPAPIAIGAGFAVAFTFARDVPPLVPPSATLFPFHFAIGAALLGVVTSLPRVPAAARWSLRVAACAAVVWLLLRGVATATWPGDATRALWLVGLAVAIAAVWLGVAWRADRVRGYPAPLALLLVAAASGHAIGFWVGSGFLGQLAGMIAAALTPVVLLAVFDREIRLGAGAAGVAVLLLASVWICAAFLNVTELPLPAAGLFAAATLAVLPRPRWLGPVVAAAVIAGALYLTWNATRPPEGAYDEPDPYEQFFK